MSDDSKELLALADEFEAGTAKALATGYEEYGPQFQRKRKLVVDALRYAAAPQSGMRAEGKALQLVCSSRPRPSVHRTGKGHQHWRRDVHHVLAPPSTAGRDKVTLCKLDASEWLVIGDAPANLADNPDLCARCKLALPAASPAAPSSPRSAGPTGVEAAKIVAEYIRLRSTIDEDDAANIIHILHEAGVRFRLPNSNAAEGADETDALARENHWRKLEGRDPATPKPAPDAMREALEPFASIASDYDTGTGKPNADHHPVNVRLGDCRNARIALSTPVPQPDGAAAASPYQEMADELERRLKAPPPDDVRSALIKVLCRLFKAISAKGIEVKYYSSLEPDGGAPWKEFITSMDEAAQFIKEQVTTITEPSWFYTLVSEDGTTWMPLRAMKKANEE